MGNVFTLDSLKEELQERYAPFEFEAEGNTFQIRNLLRLGKKDRDLIKQKVEVISSEGEDADEDEMLAACQDIFKVATADSKGAQLVKTVGDDILLNIKLFEHWMEATGLGEASDSENS